MCIMHIILRRKTMKRQCAVLTAPKRIEIIEEEIPALKPDQVLYRMVSGGLCHSEVPTYTGDASTVYGKYNYKSYVKGVEFPRGLGHEPVCVIEEVGSAVKDFKPGDMVTGYLHYAFASHVVDSTVGMAKIPDVPGIKREYCLGEPMACVTNIVRSTQAQYGDTVAVIGCGMMGLLAISSLANAPLENLIAIDMRDDRLENAKKYGASVTVNPSKENVEEKVMELTNGRGVDTVIEISGSFAAIGTALKIIRPSNRYSAKGRGKILLTSVYARETMWTTEMGYDLMIRTPELHSVHPDYSTDFGEDVRRAVMGYVNRTMPIDTMISHEFKFENIADAFATLYEGKPDYQKGIVLF